MGDFQIYGVTADNKRTLVAYTPSARAAREYRDREGSAWDSIVVCSAKSDHSEAELDDLADNEEPSFQVVLTTQKGR